MTNVLENLPLRLTPRWYPLRAHETQTAMCRSRARFIVNPSGRRSGKTERAKRQMIKIAMREYRWEDPRYAFAAPTRDQAKAIYWSDLKAMIPYQLLAEPPRETELMIKLVTGSEIHVIGMDKPERVEGRPWNGLVLDEFANMKAQAWTQNVRPALSDRRGFCWFVGVPEGRNHYYDLAMRAQADDTGEWGYFHWNSADILPPDEIEAARRDLDELSFKQEYEGSFVSFQGAAYYAFDRGTHCARLREEYDALRPLVFCFDFNVEPGVAVVCQEMKLPNKRIGTAAIGEVYIPRNSNTESVCKKLINDWRDHRGYIYVYGDATGGARGSAKTEGSDWDIVKRTLRSHYGDRVIMKVPKHNPTERSRVNAVNTRLRTGDGAVRFMVDIRYCEWLVRDLEGVALLEGGSGELDKRADPKLTHNSDAVGYYIRQEFPIDKRQLLHEELAL